jgi:type I restriction enzyme R subunit
VRQAALGDPLVPYEARVENGVRKILASRDWTPAQKRWLNRIGRPQRAASWRSNHAADGAFAQNGGFPVIDQEFDHRL